MLFISYKSHNADVAREVADALLANGVNVWFAEYQVLFGNYDDFQKAVNEGIDRASHALLFTNNR